MVREISGEDGEVAGLAGVAGKPALDAAVVVITNAIKLEGSVTGRERSRIPCTSVKMAVLAPMPRASVMIAVSREAGRLAQLAKCVANILDQLRHRVLRGT